MSDLETALEEGAHAACRWPDGLSCHSSAAAPACDFCRGQAASIVLATLNALPTAWVRDTYGIDAALFVGFMREAVEAAAREEGR